MWWYIGFFTSVGTISAVISWYRRPSYAFGIRRILASVAMGSASLSLGLQWILILSYLARGAPYSRETFGYFVLAGIISETLGLFAFAGRGRERYAYIAGLAGLFLWMRAGLSVAVL